MAAWLLIAPWMLNYSDAHVVVWNGAAVALVIAASSVAAMLKFAIWEEWIGIAAGLWLFASPWFLKYAVVLAPGMILPATANHMTVGIVMVFLSMSELTLWEAANGVSEKVRRAPPNG